MGPRSIRLARAIPISVIPRRSRNFSALRCACAGLIDLSLGILAVLCWGFGSGLWIVDWMGIGASSLDGLL